jgi:pimeloyl-ACP methyl ester carboxylesterase
VTAESESIVLVHGLWMHGAVFFRQKTLLARRGFAVRTFSYPSVRRGLSANVDALDRFIGTLDAERIHLVGHSLGGLLLLCLLSQHREPRIGRAVLMGPPCCGSHSAKVLMQLPGMSAIVGHSVRDWLALSAPRTAANIEIGVISGDRGIGLGRLLPGLPKPNDGIVAVEETRLAQATDAITLHVGHSEMLFSTRCADQITAFLRSGRFLHPLAAPR